MGEEMTIRAGNRRPVQAQRLHNGWTEKARSAFLDHLAATCNVRAAVDAVGLSTTGAYAVRRRDATFAEQWRMALLTGYDRLEGALLRKAIAAVEEVTIADADAVAAGPISVEQALKLLERHQIRERNDQPSVRERRTDSRATQAETDAMLVARLKMLRLRREAQA